MVGDLPPSEEDVQRLREETESAQSRGELSGGGKEVLDIAPEYRAWLQDTWGSSSVKGGVVLDPGNGCWAGRVKPFLEEAFPGVEFTAIHDTADGLFPERGPDSARPQHLKALARTVQQQRADMGIAFDGDGDRVAFVDEEGCPLTAEEAAWILVQSFGEAWQDRLLVYDIKCSDRIAEAVRGLGGRPMLQRSGHAFIRTSMIQEQALFGTEVSGHFFYGELQGGDDGLFTACRMLRCAGESGKSLAGLRRACPPIFTTPDLRLGVEPEDQDGIIEQLKGAFKRYPQGFVDGVRIEFPHGWALVRKSVTASQLTFRFEGDSAEGLERIVREFCDGMPELGTELYGEYEKEKAGRE